MHFFSFFFPAVHLMQKTLYALTQLAVDDEWILLAVSDYRKHSFFKEK